MISKVTHHTYPTGTVEANLATSLQRRLGSVLERLFDRVGNTPMLIGLFIAGVGLVLLIGVIMDADWVLEGGNGRRNIASISRRYGRKTARVLMGLLACAFLAGGLVFAAWSHFTTKR